MGGEGEVARRLVCWAGELSMADEVGLCDRVDMGSLHVAHALIDIGRIKPTYLFIRHYNIIG